MILIISRVFFFSITSSSFSVHFSLIQKQIPKDNSHYMEGRSRYLWVPDDRGKTHLVDLHARGINKSLYAYGSHIEYWLYTRTNKEKPVKIIGTDHLIQKYNGNRPLFVLIHGWFGDPFTRMNIKLRIALLSVSDCNVIIVNWEKDAGHFYPISVEAVPYVGRAVGRWLNWLINGHNGNWARVHIIGFSLGGHISGNAGRTVNGQVARITGLDPAGPMWLNSEKALNKDDAIYVEVIHTSIQLGIEKPIGRTDFYPNGGAIQPDCLTISVLCNHNYAFKLMEMSIYRNQFIGHLCSNLTEARVNKCRGETLHMGNIDFEKRGSGIYGLKTKISRRNNIGRTQGLLNCQNGKTNT